MIRQNTTQHCFMWEKCNNKGMHGECYIRAHVVAWDC